MSPLSTLPAVSRNWLWVGMLFWSAGLFAADPEVDLAEVLPGRWQMIDETPSLMHPSNSENFTVIRVSAGESQWADGAFYIKWPGKSRPERGYYSVKTGRVWLTTYRWVNNKEMRIEYHGVIKTDGGISWDGTGATTRGGKFTWPFVAKKL